MAKLLRVEYNRKMDTDAHVEYYSNVTRVGSIGNGSIAVHILNQRKPIILHNVYYYNYEDDMQISENVGDEAR